jgi:phospholipid transport system substrate-binding protein
LAIELEAPHPGSARPAGRLFQQEKTMAPRPGFIIPVSVVAGPCLLILGGCSDWADGSPKHLALSENPARVERVELQPASEQFRFEHPAAERIDALGAEVMAVLSDASMSPEIRKRHFREMLARELDIPLLARFMLGRYWRKAAPEARQAYEDAFAEYILGRYASLLGSAREIQGFKVVGAKATDVGDVLVETRILRGGADPIAISWRMRDRDGRFVIIDLVIEGVSMALTQRQEFASILRANGGRVEELVLVLRDKVT